MLAVPTCLRTIKAYHEDLINDAKQSLIKALCFYGKQAKEGVYTTRIKDKYIYISIVLIFYRRYNI